eukprot:scaffold119623_cov46-Prasinocladus_malaysianus.AAC.1
MAENRQPAHAGALSATAHDDNENNVKHDDAAHAVVECGSGSGSGSRAGHKDQVVAMTHSDNDGGSMLGPTHNEESNQAG